MLLRRITKHVKDQNWLAVGIDFAIVVIGVFIGIQVANWNDARSDHNQETELLIELKNEIAVSIEATNNWKQGYENVHASAQRALDYVNHGDPCTENCWVILADFFHASRWNPVGVTRSTYNEMRSMGLPRSRQIIDLTEAYLFDNAFSVMQIEKPAYQEHVRGLIPARVHDAIWAECFEHVDGIDAYNLDCKPDLPDALIRATVERIVQDPATLPTLRFWYSEIALLPSVLATQNEKAAEALSAIQAELDTR